MADAKKDVLEEVKAAEPVIAAEPVVEPAYPPEPNDILVGATLLEKIQWADKRIPELEAELKDLKAAHNKASTLLRGTRKIK